MFDLHFRGEFLHQPDECGTHTSCHSRGVGRAHEQPEVPVEEPDGRVADPQIWPIARGRRELVEELTGVANGAPATRIELRENSIRFV